jgi:hypothetical protein
MDHPMSGVTLGQEQLAEQIQKDRANLVRNDPVTTAADTGATSPSGGRVGWWPGGAEMTLMPTIMELTAAARLARPPWWPGVVAWALWALGVLAIPVAVWLDHLLRRAGRSDLVQLVPGAIPPTVAMVSATTVGAVLASRRSHHPVGWLLLALGLSLAAGGVAAAYVAYGLLARPGALPAASDVARYYPATLVIGLPTLSFVLLLTPTGSLPSPRWRWWARVTVAAPVTVLVAVGVASGPLDPEYQARGGPFDFRGLGGTLLIVNQLALSVTTLAVVVAAGSLVVRFRRARGIERQQLRWVAVAAVFQPARRSIQRAVDRRFNRRRYDTAQTITGFSARPRQQIDLDTLTTELLAVVHQTMQPTQVSLWLRPTTAPQSGSNTASSAQRQGTHEPRHEVASGRPPTGGDMGALDGTLTPATGGSTRNIPTQPALEGGTV